MLACSPRTCGQIGNDSAGRHPVRVVKSAALMAEVQPGDILCEVDGRAVLQLPPSQISPHLLGPKDTHVVVAFKRGEERVVADLFRQ